MPDKKRAVHPEKEGKKGKASSKENLSSSSTPKSRSKKNLLEEKAKEKEKDDEDDGQDEEKVESKAPVKSQEVVQQSTEKGGVQMRYVPYSPQYLGPQQQSQGHPGLQPISAMPMGTPMAMGMQVPMQALIPVFSPMEGVLPGLEALAISGGCYVKQELDIIEMFSGFEMNNRYSVLNSVGQRIYLAGENTGCCTRFTFGHNRPFKMDVFNGVGDTILMIERKQNYALCWCGGRVAGSHVTVTHVSTGEEIGSVRQTCNICNPKYSVVDTNKTLLLNIRGPSCGSFCPLLMCCDVKFGMTDPENNEVGTILKTFQMLELVSDVTCFGVKYSEKLQVNVKALILAAVICIDFSYFEGNQGMRGSGGGGYGSYGGGYGGRRGGGGKCSLNLSGCRCVWLWFYISVLTGFYVYYYFFTDRDKDRYGNKYD